MLPTEIKGFQVLLVSLPDNAQPHYIYYRRHESKQDSSSKHQSLFLCNVPVETTLAVVRKFLSQVAIGSTVEEYIPSVLTGKNEEVWIDLRRLTSELAVEEPKSEGHFLPKNCGIVKFVDKAACSLAFLALKKLTSARESSAWPLSSASFGRQYYLEQMHKKVLDPQKLAEDVAQALIDFDRAEAESVADLKRQTQMVDEDGFTLVVGSHRKTKAGILGKQRIAATVELDKAQDKLKKKEHADFYRFQLRQKKKEEMNELLVKFKLDQEKVRNMREKKRYRPY